MFKTAVQATLPLPWNSCFVRNDVNNQFIGYPQEQITLMSKNEIHKLAVFVWSFQ